MSSDRSLSVTPEAEEDLREIYRYSREVWSAAQQSRYAKTLADVIRRLAVYPDLGRPRDEIAVGIRGVGAGQHIIYYRATGDEIRVLRVLHVRMDPTGHLDI